MKEKTKTLDKNNENLKLKKIAKKQKLKERGITLIALVVTIIILLILAGVTLNIALSDNGLFSKAKKATEDYKQAQSEEEDLISQFATQMYSEYVGATVEGYSLEDNKEKLVTITSEQSGIDQLDTTDNAGNEIKKDEDGNQTFTTEENMAWRIWDYDGNTLRIIGDTTSQGLTLKGAAGYNNGVWALDYICKELYSNNKLGVTVTNLKRTDIQQVSTYDYTKCKHKPNTHIEDTSSGDNNSMYFGETKMYETNNQYPEMWQENDKDWTYEYDKENKIATGKDKECKKWEVIGTGEGKMSKDMNQGETTTKFKQSYYYHEYKQNEFINAKYYDLIFKKTDESAAGHYWLAGRYVRFRKDDCLFGLQCVDTDDDDGDRVNGNALCCSDRGDDSFLHV